MAAPSCKAVDMFRDGLCRKIRVACVVYTWSRRLKLGVKASVSVEAVRGTIECVVCGDGCVVMWIVGGFGVRR